ncbi:MAG: S8 family serine peptidase [Dokdonella sp.]|uniref:S8 family serine peptidase n=1 Tax=Dokdonella sp. TaxID=2291710 RepID=UPI003267096B
MIRPSVSLLLLVAALAAPAATTANTNLHWVRIDATRAALQRVHVSADVRADYGRFQWAALDDAALARVRAAGVGVTEIERPFVIDLGGERFDPGVDVPNFGSRWYQSSGSNPEGNDLRLLQFAGPVRQTSLDALRSAGLEPVQYIHPFTYVVWGSRTALDAVSARSSDTIRWSGDFLPAYRVLPRWRGLDARPLDVHVIGYRNADIDDAVRVAGATIVGSRVVDRHFSVTSVRVAGNRIADLASIAGVYSVQPAPLDGGLRGEMSDQVNAGNVDGGNFAFPGYLAYLSGIGVNGAGVIVADVDGGIYDTHPDLVHRMLPCVGDTCGGSATDSHGTHTAGIIAADGSSGVLTSGGFLRGLGMAPGANLIEQIYDPTFTQAGGMLKLMTESVRNHAVMSGNSWGPAGSPLGYDDDTRQVDVGVRDSDPVAAGDQPLNFVLSFMNGNGGTSTQGTPDEGKNLFTIGSTKMQTSSTVQIAQIDDVSSNSAHGPALDGRSIPAMVAPGCSVDSSISATGYGLLCGTSMASPHVTGASALFVEYYRNLTGADPSPALTKAAFTAVAKNLTGHNDADGNVMTHLFDNKQGWGRMLITPVLAPAQAVQYVDQSVVFENTGESWTHTYTAADPTQPMRIMLTWTDAPGHGLGGSTPAWNNDLDLRVTANGSTFLGNALDNAGWSVTGGSADAKNNTEAVFLQAAQHAGSLTIDVLATDINSDALPNSGDDTQQDFALVCYNCAPETTAHDVSIAATATPDPVSAGATLVYAVDVHNTGPSPADSVAVSLALPDDVDFSAASGDGWTCSRVRLGVSCALDGILAVGDAPALTIAATVGMQASGPLIASVSVSSAGTDANATNDAITVVTTLLDRIFTNGFDEVPGA